MIVIEPNGEKIYGIIPGTKDASSYITDASLVAQDFIADNLEILGQMISKFKQEQDE